MKSQIQTASEMKSSSLASTLAHETRKSSRVSALFIVAAITVSAAFSSCAKSVYKGADLEQTVWQSEKAVLQAAQAIQQSEQAVQLLKTIMEGTGGGFVKYEYDEQNRIVKILTYADDTVNEPYMTQTFTYSENELVRTVTNIDGWRRAETFSIHAQKSNPEFMGDITEYLSYNLQYPEEAIKAGVNIRVTYSFVVEEDGTVTDIKWISTHIERDSKNPDVIASQKACERAAYDLIASTSNKWLPVKEDNLPVRTKMSLPIWFRF
jgi:hypothetical protein